jgi:hypothetical protein
LVNAAILLVSCNEVTVECGKCDAQFAVIDANLRQSMTKTIGFNADLGEAGQCRHGMLGVSSVEQGSILAK